MDRHRWRGRTKLDTGIGRKILRRLEVEFSPKLRSVVVELVSAVELVSVLAGCLLGAVVAGPHVAENLDLLAALVALHALALALLLLAKGAGHDVRVCVAAEAAAAAAGVRTGVLTPGCGV